MSTPKLCTVSADLRHAGIYPVSESTGNVLPDLDKTYQYKWDGEEVDGIGTFMVLVDGVWMDFISIDFDFPFQNEDEKQ